VVGPLEERGAVEVRSRCKQGEHGSS